jgi:hypothetical protein
MHFVKRKFTAPVAAFFSLVLIYTSCTRIDTTDIGNGLIPAVDNVNTFDTILDVVTDNVLFDDSSKVYDNEDHALGTISNDPVFGKMVAGFYVNMAPASFGVTPFGVLPDSINFPIDSVVLSFAFKGIYGDSMNIQRFHVYEIDSTDLTFKDSARGYSIHHPGFALGPLLKTHEQNLDRLSDEFQVKEGTDTLSVKNQMRIKLDNSFGQRLLRYDTSIYGSDSVFRTHFAGFALIPDSTFGNPSALTYFNLKDNSNTKLTIFYKARYSGKSDSVRFTSFTFNNYRSSNRITRSITGTEYANAINNPDLNAEKLYIASSPGSYATVKIPGLQELSNRVIHRAELIVTPLPSTGQETYQAPYYMFLDAWDSAAALPRTIQNDFVQSSSTGDYNLGIFGGFLTHGVYNFDLSRYVQGIVTRKETSYTLRIYAPYKTKTIIIPQGHASLISTSTLLSIRDSYYTTDFSLFLNPQIAFGRTVLAGGSHPTSKMRLRIIYSKI